VADGSASTSRHGVLQLVTSTDRRGAEVVANQLAEELARRGLAVDTVALWPGTAGTQLDLEALGHRRRDPKALSALVRRARRAAVVLGQGSSTLPFGAAACWLTRTPFVYRSIGDPAFWATTAARRARVGVAVRRAEVVVAIWAGAADALMRLYGLPAARVEVIPNGVPVAAFSPTPVAERAARRRALAGSIASGLDPDVSLIGYLGALSEEKDPLLAIDAMAHLTDAQLIVAGEGPLREAVRARADAVGRVHVVGGVDDVAGLLAACDALVVPSRSEGIPAVTIEAGLAGLPVVAAAVGGIPEVVVDGETGRLVADRRPESFAAALRDVLDEATGDAMGAAARSLCEVRFGLDAAAERWRALLERVGGTVR